MHHSNSYLFFLPQSVAGSDRTDCTTSRNAAETGEDVALQIKQSRVRKVGMALYNANNMMCNMTRDDNETSTSFF